MSLTAPFTMFKRFFFVLFFFLLSLSLSLLFLFCRNHLLFEIPFNITGAVLNHIRRACVLQGELESCASCISKLFKPSTSVMPGSYSRCVHSIEQAWCVCWIFISAFRLYVMQFCQKCCLCHHFTCSYYYKSIFI